jgi:hypothetical protein
MKNKLKRIFANYLIYNKKGKIFPILKTELGKELFAEVNDLIKSIEKNKI